MTLSVMGGNEAVSVVWIIDPEQWPRALLRAELIERGIDAVGYLRAGDALAQLGSRFPDLIVVDLRAATRDEVSQLFQAGVPVIAIAGIPESPWISEFPWSAVLRRPISIGEIADTVKSRI